MGCGLYWVSSPFLQRWSKCCQHHSTCFACDKLLSVNLTALLHENPAMTASCFTHLLCKLFKLSIHLRNGMHLNFLPTLITPPQKATALANARSVCDSWFSCVVRLEMQFSIYSDHWPNIAQHKTVVLMYLGVLWRIQEFDKWDIHLLPLPLPPPFLPALSSPSC